MAQAKTLSQTELDLVLNYVSTKKYALRDRALILTSFLGGLRVAEIASLKMGDVLNLDGTIKNEIRLSAAQTKGKHPRTVFVSQRLQTELANYLTTRYIKEADIPSFIQIIVWDLVLMAYVCGSISFIRMWVLAVAAAIQEENFLLLLSLIKGLVFES
jgi:integrase